MSYYPKHQRDRRSQQGPDRNSPISPNTQRVYRPKNQALDLSSSPLSPPSSRSPISSSWNQPDILSSSAPGRQPDFPSSSPSASGFSSSYTGSQADHLHRNSQQQNRSQNQNNPGQKSPSKPRSQSFGTGANNNNTNQVSYMRKLTLEDIRKFCEKTQSAFWSGEQLSQRTESGGNLEEDGKSQTTDWKRDLSLQITSKLPQRLAEVKVKKNSLRGKTFIVFEGEPEERASSVWLTLPHKLSTIRSYQDGEEYFTKAATYISRRMKAYLKDKGGVSRINYKIIIETNTLERRESESESEHDLGSSRDSNGDGDQEVPDDKKLANDSVVVVFVVAYQ